MKKNIFLISSTRRRMRTMLLFLLVGIVSFALVSQVVEYLIVNQETARLGQHYRPIGQLASTNSEDQIKILATDEGFAYGSETNIIFLFEDLNQTFSNVSEGANLVESSRYVTTADNRRVVSGVMDGIHNADLDGISSDILHWQDPFSMTQRVIPRHLDKLRGVHVSDMLLYGEFQGATPYFEDDTLYEYELVFKIDHIEAGYPDYVGEDGKIVLHLYFADHPHADQLVQSMQRGQRYFFRAYYNPFVGQHTTWKMASRKLIVLPLTGVDTWFLPVAVGETVDFSQPQMAQISQMRDELQQNTRTLQVVATKDMSAMPDMQEASKQYYLTQGRWLDGQDHIEQNRVCVVSEEFADLRGLSLGDPITLTLRDKPDLYSENRMYLHGDDFWKYQQQLEQKPDWRNQPTHQETFEIVGMYRRTYSASQPARTVANTQMFIPDSCLPAQFTGAFPFVVDGRYSFVIGSPWELEAFMQEKGDQLKQMGYTLTFVDNNFENFRNSVDSLKRSTLINVAAFAIMFVLAGCLLAFLYLRQTRGEYAILRALGQPRHDAIIQWITPFVIIALIGVVVGGVAAWFYAFGKSAHSLSALDAAQTQTLAPTLSAVWLVALCAGLFLLLLVLVATGIVTLAKRPVLESLQNLHGNANVVKQQVASAPDKKERPVEAATGMRFGVGTSTSHTPIKQGVSHVVSTLARYSRRTMMRSWLKSILVIVVALAFVLALGWMQWTIDRSNTEMDRLYNTTIVEGEIVLKHASQTEGTGRMISAQTADQILHSESVQEYLVVAETVFTSFGMVGDVSDASQLMDPLRAKTNAVLLASNNFENLLHAVGGDVTIKYLDGYSHARLTQSFDMDAIPIVVSEQNMQQMGLQLGDEVLLFSDNASLTGRENTLQKATIVGQFDGRFAISAMPDILLSLPSLSAVEEMRGYKPYYSLVRFTLNPAYNRNLQEFQAQSAKIIDSDLWNTNELLFILWDGELRQVIAPLERTLMLLSILFPVTAGAALLVAAGLCVLFIMQSAKEAALMRALGTKKLWVGSMLCIQQLLLCLLGGLLGLVALYVLSQSATVAFGLPSAMHLVWYCLAAMAGAVIACVLVLRKTPFELLQVKE
ncbi:ABC transporter permease [Eubacteriales bacterium OttesenSCG-928-N14]|nr:ABC transporter permease [Eubacteriales bacterium OttesenSCG-928-N14]